MAQKKVKTSIKLVIEAGKANPAPPIGPALGQAGVNIMEFCKAYNDKTKDKMGEVIPVIITVYQDSSFDFELKSPPAAKLILASAGLKKGSDLPGRKKVGKISMDDAKQIAEKKMADLNAMTIEAATAIIVSQTRSMGIEVI